VVDNSIDEALVGFADMIEIIINKDVKPLVCKTMDEEYRLIFTPKKKNQRLK